MAAPALEIDGLLRQAPMGELVRCILEHPAGLPWVMQDIGLLALRLDEVREYRLHAWDPASCVGDPPIHDHPFDFTSTVFAGEMTNTLYEEHPSGVEYQRDRYSPSDEQDRVTDTVRLSGSSGRFTAGQSYSQAAHELHRSNQAQGTVTVIRRAFTPVDALTVCQAPGSPWVSGQSRPASAREVNRITAAALELME